MRGRPRKYAFAALSIGDRLCIALNGRDAESVRRLVLNAAGRYRETYDARFALTTDVASMRGFLVVERTSVAPSVALLIANDANRIARLDALSRTRALSAGESRRLETAIKRIEKRRAA